MYGVHDGGRIETPGTYPFNIYTLSNIVVKQLMYISKSFAAAMSSYKKKAYRKTLLRRREEARIAQWLARWYCNHAVTGSPVRSHQC